eukprot:4736600-Ditylum_brightwellii.AAC.1
MEGADFHTSGVKQNTMKEYISRVSKNLNVNLLGDIMMMVIFAYTVPILCYTFGIMKWARAKMHKLDGKTCKLLTTHGFHHPKIQYPPIILTSTLWWTRPYKHRDDP